MDEKYNKADLRILLALVVIVAVQLGIVFSINYEAGEVNMVNPSETESADLTWRSESYDRDI